MSGLVKVGEIPYTDVDLTGITSGAKELRTVASAVRDGTADIVTAWQPISGAYSGPADEQLYAVMTPIGPHGTSFGDNLDTAAKALDDFVTEVTPIIAKLKSYVTRGNQLHRDVAAFTPGTMTTEYGHSATVESWDQDETLTDENNAIINGVAAQVVAYQAAERTCANTIRGLSGLSPLHAISADGKDDGLGYGYKELPAGTKLPWGSASDRKESCSEKTVDFLPNMVKGVLVDGIWGTVKGLGTLIGVDGTGFHWETAGASWSGILALTGFNTKTMQKDPELQRESWTELLKATVGWDEWGKDPGRAFGQALWGIGSLVIPIAGEAGKVGAAGKVGEVAGAVGKAGKYLDLVDAGAWASKGLTAVLPKLGDLKGIIKTGIGDAAHGFSGRLADFQTGLGDFLHGRHGDSGVDAPPVRSEADTDVRAGSDANANAHADGGDATVHAPEREPALVGAGGHGEHGETATGDGGGSDSGSTGGSGHGDGVGHSGESIGNSAHGAVDNSGHGADEPGFGDDVREAGAPGSGLADAPRVDDSPSSGGDDGGSGRETHETPDWMPEVKSGVRFFGAEQLQYFERANATLGRPGDAMFMMPEADAAKVTDALSASIESGMAPSAMKAWQTGGDVFGVVVPVENLAARLPTFADAGGWEHFVPGGHTAVKVGGEFFINETREFVVEGGIPMPPGSVVFKLLDGGHWEPILIYG